MCVYLWVCQAGVVGFEVVDDALCGSRQSGTAHQQHKQHDIWEGGCQVHHLQCTQRAGGCGQDGTDTEKTGGDTPVPSSKKQPKMLESWSLKNLLTDVGGDTTNKP